MTCWFELLILGLGSPSVMDVVDLPWGARSLRRERTWRLVSRASIWMNSFAWSPFALSRAPATCTVELSGAW
jgi:hypothetical protein